MDGEELKKTYLGKRVCVTIYDPYHPYIARVGTVTLVDDAGQLHGTWGSLAAIPGEDIIELLD